MLTTIGRERDFLADIHRY